MDPGGRIKAGPRVKKEKRGRVLLRKPGHEDIRPEERGISSNKREERDYIGLRVGAHPKGM